MIGIKQKTLHNNKRYKNDISRNKRGQKRQASHQWWPRSVDNSVIICYNEITESSSSYATVTIQGTTVTNHNMTQKRWVNVVCLPVIDCIHFDCIIAMLWSSIDWKWSSWLQIPVPHDIEAFFFNKIQKIMIKGIVTNIIFLHTLETIFIII